MKVFNKKADLEAVLSAARSEGKKIGLVPTMGALHAGHASLVKRSVSENDVTVVSVFVNPTQFNDKNDLKNYPRALDADCELLQNVEILTGDYQQTLSYAKGNTLFYFDPPYRPLNHTSSFNDYTKEAFNDLAQCRLKEFCDQVEQAGYHFMLSNSDCQDMFFDDLYTQYIIERVWASRSVNANASKRGKLTEILVHNYHNTKKKAI